MGIVLENESPENSSGSVKNPLRKLAFDSILSALYKLSAVIVCGIPSLLSKLRLVAEKEFT